MNRASRIKLARELLYCAKMVLDANKNLEGINTELKQQGEQIVNVKGTTANISSKVSTTDRVMTKMERRQTCGKVVGIIGIVVVGLADIALLVITNRR